MTTIDELVRNAATTRPDHPALIDAPNRSSFFGGEPRRLTWTEVDNAVNALAGVRRDHQRRQARLNTVR